VDTNIQSLAGLRNRAIGQIINDAVVSGDQVSVALEQFAWLFSCLGFAGITGHIVDHPTIGLTSDLEVIHPRELFPFPLVTEDFTQTSGLMRQRWVPLEHLKDLYGRRISKEMLDKMDWYEVEAGEQWGEREDNNTIGFWGPRSAGSGGGMSTGGIANNTMKVARIRELWVTGVQDTVTRYVAASGEAVFEDQDLSMKEVYCPIGTARFFNNGTWHGAGMFDLLFSHHRQFEMLCKSLYSNVRDTDRYGVLVLPQGQINQNQLLREVGKGLRVMFWEPDAVSEGFSPFPLTPFNTGDMPGRVAQFAKEAMASVNPIQDLVQEKGRVDSATGLAFLEEQITKALTTPTNGVDRAWGMMYRALTHRATGAMMNSARAIPVSSLTLDLAGAVIDMKTMEVTFTENPLPKLSGLQFRIRALSPKSTVARKQEALQLWQFGIEQDPMAFRLFALKEGLDFAMWTDEDKGSWEMGIITILSLYNDGETPGMLILTPHTTRPEILQRQLNGFMTGPYLVQASPEVVDAFGKLRLTLMSFMGLTLPGAVPNPDDAAMLIQGGAELQARAQASQQPQLQ
jgi:hypothetical protein